MRLPKRCRFAIWVEVGGVIKGTNLTVMNGACCGTLYTVVSDMKDGVKMRAVTLRGLLVAAGLATAVAGFSSSAFAAAGYPYGGSADWAPGWMMGGYGHGGGPGPWMMGRGYGYGIGTGSRTTGAGRAGRGRPAAGALDLSGAQAKARMEKWLKALGNPNIKVGAVAAKRADTITADIPNADLAQPAKVA